MAYPTDGQIAYDAYKRARGGFAVNGDKLPAFREQSPELKKAWEAAASAVCAEYDRQTALAQANSERYS